LNFFWAKEYWRKNCSKNADEIDYCTQNSDAQLFYFTHNTICLIDHPPSGAKADDKNDR